MRFKKNNHYRVISDGASLLGLPNLNKIQEHIVLKIGDILIYVGHEYAGIDYDVIQPPYFRYKGKDYVFHPSSFSGLVPHGYLEQKNN